MATPAIGSKNFITMAGYEGLIVVDRVVDVSRDGVDGHAFLEVGKRSNVVTVVTEADVANVVATESGYHALEKTFVTVTTPHGKSIANVFVHSVHVSAQAFIRSAGGLLGGAVAGGIVRATWELQATDVS